MRNKTFCKPKPQFFEPIGIVTILATARFVVAEKFVCTEHPVNIVLLGDNFKRWFLEKVEKPAGEVILLSYAKPKKAPSVDGPIFVKLGDRVETTLAQVYTLMTRQPNGEKGILIANGRSNIFYVRDVNDMLREVVVDYIPVGWSVCARSANVLHRYDRVFYLNS